MQEKYIFSIEKTKNQSFNDVTFIHRSFSKLKRLSSARSRIDRTSSKYREFAAHHFQVKVLNQLNRWKLLRYFRIIEF